MADFLVELESKMAFWKNLIKNNGQLPSYDLASFFDVNQFLYSLVQNRSRLETVSASLIRNEFEILDYYEHVEPVNMELEPYVTYVHGMWLEGADWDMDTKMLIESHKGQRFVRFPALRIKTVLKNKRMKPKVTTPRNESSMDEDSE